MQINRYREALAEGDRLRQILASVVRWLERQVDSEASSRFTDLDFGACPLCARPNRSDLSGHVYDCLWPALAKAVAMARRTACGNCGGAMIEGPKCSSCGCPLCPMCGDADWMICPDCTRRREAE